MRKEGKIDGKAVMLSEAREIVDQELEFEGLCNIREINPEYSSEGLMLKLKLQYFGHLM